MTDLGHVAIVQAILDLTTQMANGNPFVVLGPVLYDDNYTPAEGTGVIINGVGVGAAGFPVAPGHAYTFSLDINNIFQVLCEQNTDGLWYRIWDNVGGVWLAWLNFASTNIIPNENAPPPLTKATDGNATRIEYAVNDLSDITFSGFDTWRIMFAAKGDGVTKLGSISLDGHGTVVNYNLGSLQLTFSVHITLNDLRITKTGSPQLSLSIVALGVN